MREGQIHKSILMLVLVLAVAGCAGVQEPAKPDRDVKGTPAIAADKPRPQSEEPPKIHVVRSRFEAGPSDGELTLIFDVSPVPEALPSVRWLGATPRDDARTLAVRSDQTGRYSAVLADVPPVADGRVLIELSDPGNGSFDIHSAEFALREHVADRPSSRPSRDGRFVVFTKPEGVSPVLRLLIGSSEQPVGDLPPGVTSGAVVGVYSLDFLPASDAADGWQLTMAVTATDVKPALFYLAKGEAVWRVLDSTTLEGHSLLGAGFAGPGTYMLVREVTR
jgi:hypothetical protein